MSEQGWIKAHRHWMDDPTIWRDPDYIAVWLYLQLNATHKEYQGRFAGKNIEVKAGQIITGRYVIAEKTGVNESKVKRILSDLQNDRLIDRQRSNKNSLITLLNWDNEQKSDRQDDRQNGQPVTTKQECKNKKENNITSSEADEDALKRNFALIYAQYPKKIGKTKAYGYYLKWVKSGFRINGKTYRATNEQIYKAVKIYVTEQKAKEQDPDHPDTQYWKDFSTLMNKSLLDYLEKVWEMDKRKAELQKEVISNEE